MATFPNLNLGGDNQNQFPFGNLFANLGLGDGAPSLLSANIGANTGPTVAAAGQSGMFGDWFSRNSMFGGVQDGTISGGWVSPLASLGSAIFGGIQGSKQLKLAQDQFKESTRQFDQNYAAQRQTTNTQLEDRQRARVASNPDAYESVESYMKRNRVV
jgi:hypothetical protein